MLFPTTFISASEKIGVGLKKQAANFLFNFTLREGLWDIPVLTFFPVQYEGILAIWAMKIQTEIILNKAPESGLIYNMLSILFYFFWLILSVLFIHAPQTVLYYQPSVKLLPSYKYFIHKVYTISH